jgi:hypothetical protein
VLRHPGTRAVEAGAGVRPVTSRPSGCGPRARALHGPATESGGEGHQNLDQQCELGECQSDLIGSYQGANSTQVDRESSYPWWDKTPPRRVFDLLRARSE